MNPTSLLRRQSAFDAAALKRTALCTLAFLFAAHAFCFFNLTYSSGSVMLHVSSGRSAQITAGQYLQPIYWRLRGGISSPLFVGMLSALYLTLTNLVLVWLLRLRNPLPVFALCGTTSVNAAVLSICAASLHTADAAFLALLLAALACACCLRVRFGTIPGALLLTAALALHADAFAFFAAASLTVMLSDLLLDKNVKAFAADALRLVLTLFAAAALFALGFALMLRRNGAQASVSLSLMGGNLPAAYLAPIRALFAPLTAYVHVSAAIRILLVIAGVLCIAGIACSQSKSESILLAAGTLLLPLCCGLTLLSSQTGAQTAPAHCLLDIWLIVLISRAAPCRNAVCRVFTAAFSAAFAVLFTGCIVFSNQVYLKKNLEFESTLSLMSRIIARMEETPGFEPGYTPVAFIGTPEESSFSVERKGFEHLSALEAAKTNYAIADDSDMIWYMWDVMGYPINFADSFSIERLSKTQQAAEMPVFPQEGSCAFVGDTLVVKLR
ncbi:MAG: hypothetical protein IKJ11_07105 [Clostridia bacterium]|nr:hypothetical protein [Clostridia bacterium]